LYTVNVNSRLEWRTGIM